MKEYNIYNCKDNLFGDTAQVVVLAVVYVV